MTNTPNIWLSQSETDLKTHFGSEAYFIAHVDGGTAITLRQFYEALADVLEFPVLDYNLEALNDSLNDLQWLEDEKIVLYITQTDRLISKERDPIKLSSVLHVLDATAEDWKWVEEDELVDRKEFYVVLQDSERIRTLLDKDEIAYAHLADRIS